MSVINTYGIHDLVDTFGNLLQEVKRVNKCRRDPNLSPLEGALAVLKGTKVLREAKTLSVIASQFRREICFLQKDGRPVEEKDVEDFIETNGIPYFMVSEIVDVLSQVRFNRRPELKLELSRTVHTIAEIVAFQFQLQKESDRFDIEEAEKVTRKLKKAVDILHESQVETRYHLECAREAMGLLELGPGKLKTLKRTHLKKTVTAGLEVLLSPSSSPPFVNLSPFAKVIVDLTCDVYKILKKSSYRRVWALRWRPSGMSLLHPDQLTTLKPFTKQYEKNSKLAICIAQMFHDIMTRDYSSEELTAEQKSGVESLKEAVFDRHDPSLISLVGHKKSWEVRYYTLGLLGSLELEGEQWRTRGEVILSFLGDKKEETLVKRRAVSIAAHLSPKNLAGWQAIAEPMQIPQAAASYQATLDELNNDPEMSPEAVQNGISQLEDEKLQLEMQLEADILAIPKDDEREAFHKEDEEAARKVDLTRAKLAEVERKEKAFRERNELIKKHVEHLEFLRSIETILELPRPEVVTS